MMFVQGFFHNTNRRTPASFVTSISPSEGVLASDCLHEHTKTTLYKINAEDPVAKVRLGLHRK